MTRESKEILERALRLSPSDKAEVVDELLTSLDTPDESIDALWKKEVEDRIDAYDEGKLRAVPLAEVLKKYFAE